MDILDYAAATHPGAVKPVNEDSILAESPVFVVADGISGCQHGAFASDLAVEVLARLVDDPELAPDQVADAVAEAHRLIREARERDHHRAATTVCGAVGLWLDEMAYWTIFNAGDSRIYRITGPDRELVQVSVDHSHVQELIDCGVITPDQARRHPDRHVITQALGAEEHLAPDYWLVPMVQGDRFLLCSDGLLRDTSFDDVTRITRESRSAADAVGALLDLALEAGARDNVSVIVVDVLASPGPTDDFPHTLVLHRPEG